MITKAIFIIVAYILFGICFHTISLSHLINHYEDKLEGWDNVSIILEMYEIFIYQYTDRYLQTELRLDVKIFP